MEIESPTRYNLLKLKKRYEMFSSGLLLIKKRREALSKEFMGLVDECVEKRAEISRLLSSAQKILEFAKAFFPGEMESFYHASRRYISFDITIKNLWGVNIPEIEEKPVVRTLGAIGVSPVGEKIAVVDISRQFETVVDKVLKIASRENRLTRLGDMIRSDTRKINSMEETVLPGIKKSTKSIARTLEERERGDIFRLKRYKKRRSGESSGK